MTAILRFVLTHAFPACIAPRMGDSRMARSPVNLRLLAAIALSLTIAMSAANTRADVEAAYYSDTLYTLNITHVPDLDQRRAALPGAGSQYCVPTASMNWIAYFANHGMDYMAPGPGNWIDPARYDEMTGHLALMGQYMSTDPNDGTTGSGAMVGLIGWPPMFNTVVSHYYTTAWWSPDFNDIAHRALSGSYVIPVVGWYEDVNELFIERNGGHALTLNYCARSGSDMLLGWRDPGSDEGDTNAQSLYTTETYGIEQRFKLPVGGILPRTMSKVLNYGSAYLDEFFAIKPLFALTSQPSTLMTLNITGAIELVGDPQAAASSFDTAFQTNVLDAVIHPDNGSYVYVAEAADAASPAQVWRHDPAGGEATLVDVSLTDPTQIVVGRLRDLYVQDGEDLVRVNIDLPVPEEMSRVSLSGRAADMTYDDDADEIVLLSTEAQALIRYPHDLLSAPTESPIPPEVPLAGHGSVTWDRVHQCAWVVSDGSDSLFQLVADPRTGELTANEIAHVELAVPQAVDVDDSGRVFVSSNGHIVEFELTGDGDWVLASDPVFEDVQAGQFLQIARSHDNYLVGVHDQEAWFHVLPSDVPIPGDANGDGVVDLSDLGILATNWGRTDVLGPEAGDFDSSGTVDLSDLGILATNWGAGAARVPEPTALSLLALGALAMARRRRHGR